MLNRNRHTLGPERAFRVWLATVELRQNAEAPRSSFHVLRATVELRLVKYFRSSPKSEDGYGFPRGIIVIFPFKRCSKKFFCTLALKVCSCTGTVVRGSGSFSWFC